MKKVLLIAVIALVAMFNVASAGVVDIITDWNAAGSALDTTEVDSFYFQIDNPLLDSVLVFYEQYASTDNPSVSCTLKSTVDNIAATGNSTLQANARKATWTTVCEVFADLTTESAVQYYGLTRDNLMSAPGRYYMLQFTAGATANHDETSKILKAGVITLRQPD